MLSLRDRRQEGIRKSLKPIVGVVKSWFLEVGLDYIKSRTLTEKEEATIENFTDYCLDKLETLK